MSAPTLSLQNMLNHHAVLKVDITSQIGSGQFKLVYDAELTITRASIDSTCPLTKSPICAKAMYLTAWSQKKKIFPLYDQPSAVPLLLMELKTITWAHQLMTLVYLFIRRENEKRREGDQPPDVPRMHYVYCGLFIEASDTRALNGIKSKPSVGGNKEVPFLLEEKIPDSDGPFRKYMTNNSAVPLETALGEVDRDRGDFLSFAQHVQWVKTDGMAYIADFQGENSLRAESMWSYYCLVSNSNLIGGNTMLTDPQIITHP